MRQRLDVVMKARGLVESRSQAENWIHLGRVYVGGKQAKKSGQMVADSDIVELRTAERYVSRAGLKLASVAAALHLDFAEKTVLDVGSSTGGFTDYALQHGAVKVFAVDVGTEQLHPSLRGDSRIELHEKTNILEVRSEILDARGTGRGLVTIPQVAIIVIDVSFVSLRELLPHIATLVEPSGVIAAMVKPQFEAGKHQVNKGVIKNDAVRRDILREFESWAKQYFVIVDKADSDVAGAKGNRERFYLLKSLQKSK